MYGLIRRYPNIILVHLRKCFKQIANLSWWPMSNKNLFNCKNIEKLNKTKMLATDEISLRWIKEGKYFIEFH